ncbi:hypothetical protein [Paenibacillus paeoniae]
MLHFHVTNHSLAVGQIDVLGISSSSMLQVGDTDCVALYSMFDTPPESVVIGPLAPLPEPEGAREAMGESNVHEP